jgi:ParB/RepB/Spo0J family partition protein
VSETTTLLRDEQRTVPMSAIVVREEFNPRKRFDEAELNRMAATMTRVGLLQPLLVRPAAGAAGGYELVDGERRYRAAFQAGLTEVPVLVRARDENTDGLVEALAANFHRAAHTPVEEAQAFGRLLAAGLTRRGISEQLAVSRELVRERLEILELPEDLHSAIDDGTIPLGAVKALVTLAKIHPGLPACAVRRVSTAPTEPWRRAASWSDVIEDPVGVVTTQYADERPDLPEGVFDADCGYPLAGFALGEQGEKDLRALVQLNPAWGDREQVRVTFSAELVAQAAALGATHRSPRGYSTLIVGQEVADQLARDAIKAQLKSERARARREREADKLATTTGAETNVAADPEPETAEQAKERRRLERETELERRRQAHAFNGELGIAVLKAFAKVKVDHRVLQVLSAVDFKDDLDGLADRGARYGFPGWPQEEQTRSGKTKVVYLERYQAARKAREFLSGATTGADVAGRCLALVVMAALADEACVAQSNRSQFSLHAYKPSPYAYTAESDGGLPWREQVVELVEDLALERLPEHLTVAVREHRQHATQQQAEADRAEPQQAEPDSLEPQSAATSESLDATGREEAEAEASTPSDDSAIAE